MLSEPSSTGPSSSELLERWQKHDDHDALDELLRQEVGTLANHLRARARGMLGASVSASDLAQEAVLRMLRLDTPPEFASERELRAYLWKAAWHLLVNRMHRRRATNALDGDLSQLSDPGLQTSGGFSAVDRGEQAAALQVVLNLLEPTDREVLEKIYLRQVPIEELAGELGITRSALDMRLSRARRRLAERMLAWSKAIG